MFVSLFCLGGVAFWILVALASLVITVASEKNLPGLATLTFWATTLVLAGFMDLEGRVQIHEMVMAHPILTLLLIVLYFAVGTLWSVVKWHFYLKQARANYEYEKRVWVARQYKEGSLKGYDVPATGPFEMPNELRGNFSRYALQNLIPRVSDNKSRIMGWMALWPWSFAWTMVNDPVRTMFKKLYVLIEGTFKRMRDRTFQDIYRDVPSDFNIED